jgi:hypothetical protein
MSFETNAYKEIKQLDPDKDALRIVQLTLFHEFPWDYNRALELALYKTFAVPTISKILFNSKEFELRPQKRYDDTDLILSEIIENGYDSPRGKEVIERLNWIHSHYPIKNDDYLYTLSTFIFEPCRWIAKYGYRPLTRNEELAGFKVFQEIGKRMHIENIPETIEEFERFNLEYERKNFVFTKDNAAIAKAVEDLMMSWFIPQSLYEVGREFAHGIMQENLLKSFGYKPAPKIIQFISESVLKTRGALSLMLPPFNRPYIRTKVKSKSYPEGYKLEHLGPKPTVGKTCPYHALKGAISPN